MITSVKAPLTVDFESVPVSTKSGKAEAQYLMVPCFWGPLMSFAWGDCSIENAARDGNLTSVDYADYEVLCILGIYQQTTVTAFGQ